MVSLLVDLELIFQKIYTLQRIRAPLQYAFVELATFLLENGDGLGFFNAQILAFFDKDLLEQIQPSFLDDLLNLTLSMFVANPFLGFLVPKGDFLVNIFVLFVKSSKVMIFIVEETDLFLCSVNCKFILLPHLSKAIFKNLVLNWFSNFPKIVILFLCFLFQSCSLFLIFAILGNC